MDICQLGYNNHVFLLCPLPLSPTSPPFLCAKQSSYSQFLVLQASAVSLNHKDSQLSFFLKLIQHKRARVGSTE